MGYAFMEIVRSQDEGLGSLFFLTGIIMRLFVCCIYFKEEETTSVSLRQRAESYLSPAERILEKKGTSSDVTLMHIFKVKGVEKLKKKHHDRL